MALATKSYLHNVGFSQYSLLFSRMNPVLSLLNVAVLRIIYFLVVKRKKKTKHKTQRGALYYHKSKVFQL